MHAALRKFFGRVYAGTRPFTYDAVAEAECWLSDWTGRWGVTFFVLPLNTDPLVDQRPRR